MHNIIKHNIDIFFIFLSTLYMQCYFQNPCVRRGVLFASRGCTYDDRIPFFSRCTVGLHIVCCIEYWIQTSLRLSWPPQVNSVPTRCSSGPLLIMVRCRTSIPVKYGDMGYLCRLQQSASCAANVAINLHVFYKKVIKSHISDASVLEHTTENSQCFNLMMIIYIWINNRWLRLTFNILHVYI